MVKQFGRMILMSKKDIYEIYITINGKIIKRVQMTDATKKIFEILLGI